MPNLIEKMEKENYPNPIKANSLNMEILEYLESLQGKTFIIEQNQNGTDFEVPF